MAKFDWRKDYVICPHTQIDTKNLHHQGLRVCCTECEKKGFLLDATNRVYLHKEPLCVAKVVE